MRHSVLSIVILIATSVAAPVPATAVDDYTCSPEMVPPDRIRMHVYGDASQYLPGICRGIAEFAIVFPGAEDLPVVDFHVYTSRDEAVSKWAAVTGTSRSTASRFWNPTGGGIGAAAYRTSVVMHASADLGFGYFVGLAAHELTHIFQDAHRVSVDPYWLREGASEYVKFLALDSSRFDSLENILTVWKASAHRWDLPPPQDMIGSSAFRNSGRFRYQSAFLAFDYLIAEVGFESYANCYLQGGGGFEGCFRMTID